jgi:hypothetical protein
MQHGGSGLLWLVGMGTDDIEHGGLNLPSSASPVRPSARSPCFSPPTWGRASWCSASCRVRTPGSTFQGLVSGRYPDSIEDWRWTSNPPCMMCEVVPVCALRFRSSATIPDQRVWNSPPPIASHDIDTSLSRSCEVSIAIDDFIGRESRWRIR